MKLTLDIEHTVTQRDGKTHFDPFEPNNDLVMIGTLTDKGEEKIFTVYHNSVHGQPTEVEGMGLMNFDGAGVQELLNHACRVCVTTWTEAATITRGLCRTI